MPTEHFINLLTIDVSMPSQNYIPRCNYTCIRVIQWRSRSSEPKCATGQQAATLNGCFSDRISYHGIAIKRQPTSFPTCAYENLCFSNPCENGGSCIQINATYDCRCPCENGGNCTQTSGTLKCQCPCGFVGEHCESKSQHTVLKITSHSL